MHLAGIRHQEINPARLGWLYRRQFELSAVKSGETIAIVSDLGTRREYIEAAFGEFIPSAQGLEKEMQELAAVLECTQLGFLPPRWREKVLQPEGRSQLQERMMALKSVLKE